MSDRLRRKVIQQTSEFYADMVDQWWDEIGAGTESPIERAFVTCFYAHMVTYMEPVRIVANESEFNVCMSSEKPELPVWPQAQLRDYRVDFLIGMNYEGFREQIVVECDGHNFHDRTHKQASRDRARDRALQTLGYRVFRFTGTDLNRKPLECVNEVYGYLDTRRSDSWRAPCQ